MICKVGVGCGSRPLRNESHGKEGRKARRKGGRGEGKEWREEGREEGRVLLPPAMVRVTQRDISRWLVSERGEAHDSWWGSSLSLTKHVPSVEGCCQHHFHLRGRAFPTHMEGHMWGVFDKEYITDSMKKLCAPQEESLQSAVEKIGPRCCLIHSQEVARDIPEFPVLNHSLCTQSPASQRLYLESRDLQLALFCKHVDLIPILQLSYSL